jgi:hypothetical protein
LKFFQTEKEIKNNKFKDKSHYRFIGLGAERDACKIPEHLAINLFLLII